MKITYTISRLCAVINPFGPRDLLRFNWARLSAEMKQNEMKIFEIWDEYVR